MNKPAEGKLGRRVAKWMAIIVGGLLVLGVLMPFFAIPLEFAGLMLFGWMIYLGRVFPQITLNREMAFDATVALILVIFGLHRILRWWAEQGREGPTRWRFGWTLKIATMVLLLFATSIAAVGMVHQIAWLCREPKLIVMQGMGYQTRELVDLKQVALAVKIYAEDHEGQFPKQLDDLFPKYLDTRKLFYTEPIHGDPPEPISYYPGYNARDAEETIIVASPRPFESPGKRRRIVACLDTSARIILESEFQKLIQAQQKPVSK